MGGIAVTLEEVAQELGISHQRVSQLEKAALQKVRIKLNALNITYEDLISCLRFY